MNKIAQCFILIFWSFSAFATTTTSPCQHSESQTNSRISACLDWLATNGNIDKQRVDATLQVAHWLVDANQMSQALAEIEKLLQNDLEFVDKAHQWMLYNYAGEIAMQMRNHSKALVLLSHAAELSDADHKELRSAKTFLSIAKVLRKLGVYDFASENAIQAYDIYFKYHEMAGMADALIQLGHIYLSQNNVPQAEQALSQARDLYELQELSIGKANALILASKARLQSNDPEAAKGFLIEASRVLDTTPPEIHYRVSIKLVRAMLKAGLFDLGLTELSKLNIEQISDSDLVHFFVLESKIYLAKNDTDALKVVDAKLKALSPHSLHMKAHVFQERAKIAERLGNLEPALALINQLRSVRKEASRLEKRELTNALSEYLAKTQAKRTPHEYSQLHVSISELFIICLTMFFGGFGVNMLWNHLLSPRLFAGNSDDDLDLIVSEKVDASQTNADYSAKQAVPLATSNHDNSKSTVTTDPAVQQPQGQVQQHIAQQTSTATVTETNSSVVNTAQSPVNTSAKETNNKDSGIDPFRASLVELMNLSLDIWQQQTQLGKVELAEKSGIWKVTIDDGRLRTRALERYLRMERLPKHPRWREVLRTGYFVLGQLPESHEQYAELDALIQEVQTTGKFQTATAKASPKPE